MGRSIEILKKGANPACTSHSLVWEKLTDVSEGYRRVSPVNSQQAVLAALWRGLLYQPQMMSVEQSVGNPSTRMKFAAVSVCPQQIPAGAVARIK
jgi:hypothetical protein